MAYKNTELIKKFNVVRDYIRDFFLYGYKKRGDFEEKSKRTYEEHYRQIRSWLKEYMYTQGLEQMKIVTIVSIRQWIARQQDFLHLFRLLQLLLTHLLHFCRKMKS